MVNFACRRCGKKAFSNAKDRDEHEATCQVEPRFICGECDYRTASKCNFRRHLERSLHHRHPNSADPGSLGRDVSTYIRVYLPKSSPRMLSSRVIKNSPRSAKTTPFSTGQKPSAGKRKPTLLSTDAGCKKRLNRACSMLSSQQQSELPSASKKSHLDSEPGSGMELDALCGALNERMVTLPRSLPTTSESFSSVISETGPDEWEYTTSVAVKEEPPDELTESMSSSRAPHPTSGASTLQKQSAPPPNIRHPTSSSVRPASAVVTLSNHTVEELRTMMWDVCRQFSDQLVQNKDHAAGSPGNKEADETNVVSDDPDPSSTDNSVSRTGDEDIREDADSITTSRHSTTTNGDPSKRTDPCFICGCNQREAISPDVTNTDSNTVDRHSTTTNGDPSKRTDPCFICECNQREAISPDVTYTDSNTADRHSTTTNGGPSKRKDPCVNGESKQRETVDPDGPLTPEDEFLYGVGSLDEIRTSVERRPDGSCEWVTTVYRTWSKQARRLFPQPAGQRVLMSQTRRTMMSSVDRDPLHVLRCIDEEYLEPSAFLGDA